MVADYQVETGWAHSGDRSREGGGGTAGTQIPVHCPEELAIQSHSVWQGEGPCPSLPLLLFFQELCRGLCLHAGHTADRRKPVTVEPGFLTLCAAPHTQVPVPANAFPGSHPLPHC
jgi:hypothetical protein